MSSVLYLRAALSASSPLIIGSGIDVNTECDILIDSENNPFIPGTSLAVVCRHYMVAIEDDSTVTSIFGSHNTEQTNLVESRIFFYDAQLIEGADFEITVRDGVRLKEHNRTAVKRRKFDYEVIEVGVGFEFRMELFSEDSKKGEEIFTKIINGFETGDIRIGAKTTRGFGRVCVKEPKWLNLDLSTEEGRNLYMSYDSENNKFTPFSWKKVNVKFSCGSPDKSLYERREISFELRSFLFIRNYATTSVNNETENKIVDSEQLLNRAGRPVIPGTSWAGVFRHHCLRILKKVGHKTKQEREDYINSMFGFVREGTQKASPSRILFSESEINSLPDWNNPNPTLSRTRNAVDRFTGGAGDKKLFTTKPAYKGNGILEISILKSQTDIEKQDVKLLKNLIEICLKDLNDGFLTVGGESSTGGGLIKITDFSKWGE